MVCSNWNLGFELFNHETLNLPTFIVAHVAELVDAADSKSAIRKGVKVRFLSWAPILNSLTSH